MTAQEKKTTSWFELIENIQRLIFYASLLVIPLSIVPLPWDLSEFSMGLSLIFFASILLTLELIKLVWRGRVLIPKASIDLGLLAFITSILLSTLLSKSFPTSLWGLDFRLGSGFVLILLTVIYLYASRSFLFKSDEIVNSLRFLIIGTFIGAVFSIFSFFGMNILSFSSIYDTLFTTGLPIYSSARVSIVIWGVSLLISIYLSAISFNRKMLPSAFFSILSVLVHLIAITLFSLTQGWEIYLLIVISAIAFGLTILFGSDSKVLKDGRVNDTPKLVVYSFIVLSLTFFILSQIPFVRTSIGSASKSLITQISISQDTSLKVVTQTLSQDILSSFFGMGHETFSIAYNQYRPLNDQTLVVNPTNFINASNQIFNIMTNRGLVGLGVWVFLGYVLLKYVYSNYKGVKNDNNASWLLTLLDILSVFIFISSLFIYHTFFIIFLFLLSIALSVSLRNMIFKEKLEVYVINWGIFTHSNVNQGLRNAALGVTIVFVFLGLVLNVYALRLGYSMVNALQAEKITAQARDTISTLGEADKAKILLDSANLYASAISYNPNNDVLHRRASLIVSQYLENLATQYNKTDNEAEKKKLFDQIAIYVEISVEESKKATELAPKVYANWGARSSVYSKLVGLGLTSYTKSALTALQNSAQLNPLNYEIYYNAAQLYVLNNEADVALRTLNQLFAINPNHVPSLILAGEISSKDQDYKQALRYFIDAKKVMEESNATTNDIYDYVSKRIKELEGKTPSTNTPKAQESTKKEDEPQSTAPTDTNTSFTGEEVDNSADTPDEL